MARPRSRTFLALRDVLDLGPEDALLTVDVDQAFPVVDLTRIVEASRAELRTFIVQIDETDDGETGAAALDLRDPNGHPGADSEWRAINYRGTARVRTSDGGDGIAQRDVIPDDHDFWIYAVSLSASSAADVNRFTFTRQDDVTGSPALQQFIANSDGSSLSSDITFYERPPWYFSGGKERIDTPGVSWDLVNTSGVLVTTGLWVVSAPVGTLPKAL